MIVDELKQGEGRAVFTSSRGTQRSWIRPDNTMSIYTYHLVEALQGAGNQPGDTTVRLSNLMNYISKSVPVSALAYCQAKQIPFFDTTTEDFPIAMLRGGKGLPSGGWEAIQREVANKLPSIVATGVGNVIGDKNKVQVVNAAGGSVVNNVKQNIS